MLTGTKSQHRGFSLLMGSLLLTTLSLTVLEDPWQLPGLSLAVLLGILAAGFSAAAVRSSPQVQPQAVPERFSKTH
jgi:hypothetical protein